MNENLKIWMNGRVIPWQDAQIHLMTVKETVNQIEAEKKFNAYLDTLRAEKEANKDKED